MQSAEFHVETDETGFTFVHSEEAPYWVIDRLESAHMSDIPTPDRGESAGPFIAEYSPDDRSLTVAE